MASGNGNLTEATPNCTSDHFNASDADMTFKSSDGVLFSVHRKYIEANTGAFPGPEFDTNNETVELVETAITLELMFAFVYPSRHPDLAGTSFEVVALLAEAAEKYEIFSAMNICHIHMVNFLPQHAEAIMSYTAKHGYKEVVDKAVPLVVSQPIGNTVRLLPQPLIVPWIRQYTGSNGRTSSMTASHASVLEILCSVTAAGGVNAQKVFKKLTLRHLVNNITDITTEAKNAGCYNCNQANDLKGWGVKLETKVSEIQKFSAFF